MAPFLLFPSKRLPRTTTNSDCKIIIPACIIGSRRSFPNVIIPQKFSSHKLYYIHPNKPLVHSCKTWQILGKLLDYLSRVDFGSCLRKVIGQWCAVVVANDREVQRGWSAQPQLTCEAEKLVGCTRLRANAKDEHWKVVGLAWELSILGREK